MHEYCELSSPAREEGRQCWMDNNFKHLS